MSSEAGHEASSARPLRENSIALLLGAVLAGFVIGLALRQLERERKAAPIHDALDEIRDFIKPLRSKARRAAAGSAEAVREALDKVRDIDIDECAAPVSGWWKRLWS